MNYLHHSQSGYGWNDDRQREPIYHPDIADAIDGPEESKISEEEAIAVMAKIMNEVLNFCFERTQSGNVNLPQGFRRFCSIVWTLRPDLFNYQALAALAPHLHVTRAALSAIVRKFCRLTGVRNILMKTETACLSYSKARKASHARQQKEKAKEKPGTPCEAPGSDDQIGLNSHTEVSQ